MTNVSPTQNILARLENLKFWQDEQQQILFEKHIDEQQKWNEKMQASASKDDEHSGIDEITYSDDENVKQTQQLLLSPLRLDNSNKKPGGNEALEYESQQHQQFDDFIEKRSYLRRGEGLTRRFKVNPDVFRLKNLPKYKYAIRVEKRVPVAPVVKEVAPSKAPPAAKKRIDNLKLKSVKNPVQKTPLPVQVQVPQSTKTWAEILNPHTIQPIQPTHDSTDTNDDLNIFQLLEQRTANCSFNSQSSSILQLLDSSRKKRPVAAQPTDPLLEKRNLLGHNFEMNPHPSKIQNIKCFGEEEEEKSLTTKGVFSSSDDESELHVKFSDKVEVVERTALSTDDEEEGDNDDQTLTKVEEPEKDSIDELKTSTPNDKQSFNTFKMQLFGQQKDISTTQNHEQEILEKKEILKERLAELQAEIDNFRIQNLLLTKVKQDHELEKLQWEENRDQVLDELKDEKIKMEMFVHDEQQKCEKRWKELQKPTRRELEETSALKAKVAELEQELKNREIKHSSAQARLRSQLKILEKETKEQSLEIEALKRENKKMEAENARLRRQSNTKMLQEINKNIAKLTVPQPEAEKVVKTPPVAVAKVISHQKLTPTPARHSKESVEISQDSATPETETAKPKRTSKQMKQVIPSSSSSSSESSSDESVKKLQKIAHKSSYFKFLKTAEKNKKHTTPQLSSNVTVMTTNSNFAVDNSKVSSTPSGSASDSKIKVYNHPSPITVERNSSLAKTPISSTKKNSVQFQEPPANNINLNEMTDRATETLQNFKREVVNDDGSKDIWYPNGNIKKISSDGLLVKMLYYNKDIKETNVNEGTVKYYYAQTNTWHTTYVDGLEILEFPNGQTEHHYKDGSIEIHFPNGSICITNPLKREIEEEWKYPDGTHVDVYKNGEKILSLPNGQREIHTKDHKRREYPDGTVKLVYSDGSQETRYSNGRIRLKDKEGKLITDTENLQSTATR